MKSYVGGYSLKNVIDMRASQDMYLIKHWRSDHAGLRTEAHVVGVPTILAVVTVCYLLLHFTPGGPFDTEKQAVAATLANLNAKYHLDEPLWKQYLLYLNALLHGDLGPSFRYVDWSVNDLVKRRCL